MTTLPMNLGEAPLSQTSRKGAVLQPGMTLGVVAPCGQVLERSTTRRGCLRLEELGFSLVFGDHAHETYGYLAGQDADRAADLLTMLERDDIDGVICLRGGYGALRTLLALDVERVRRLRGGRVKPFIGFSDVTVLHALVQRELGWTTFYGPMVSSFARATPYTLGAFKTALMSVEPFTIQPDPDDPYVETLVPGRTQGRLVGGCLSLLVALLGTPWEVDTRDAILFFEDVDAEPYQIDRMLAQLLLAGKLQQCAGIVIGEHANCEPKGSGHTLGLAQVFDDLIRPLGIPTLYHLPLGHGDHLATLPLGVRAELDATRRQFRLLEPGVQ